MSAPSADDVWAVGGTSSGGLTGIVEHWNGTSWSVVPAPTPRQGGLVDGQFDAVAATSDHDVWVAGVNSRDEILIWHWNGANWKLAEDVRLGIGSEVGDLSAAAPDDAWAVGQSGGRTIGLHWDGVRWTETNPVNVRSSRLGAVTELSPSNVWAVGTTYADLDGNGPSYGLIEHWDGRAWHVVDAPVAGQFGLFDVAFRSSSDGVALGSWGAGSSRPLMLHWDGTSWTQTKAPAVGVSPGYHALAITPRAAWIAGAMGFTPNARAAIERSCTGP